MAAGKPIPRDDELVDVVFKALASKPRREILHLLSTGTDDTRCCSPDEVCACVLVEKLGLGAPTISHHMKLLVDAGLVASERRGAWVYYRLQPDASERLTHELDSVFGCEGGACK
jgi:ArsR family transcriptional regulator